MNYKRNVHSYVFETDPWKIKVDVTHELIYLFILILWNETKIVCIKGLHHPKINILLYTYPHVIPTHKSFVHLRKQNLSYV